MTVTTTVEIDDTVNELAMVVNQHVSDFGVDDASVTVDVEADT